MSVSSTSPALNRALLLSPVVLTLLALIAIPLGIMGYISLLPRNVYGGVDWQAEGGQWARFLYDGMTQLSRQPPIAIDEQEPDWPGRTRSATGTYSWSVPCSGSSCA